MGILVATMKLCVNHVIPIYMQMTTLLSSFCDYDCECTKPLLGVIEIVVCMYYARIHSAFLYGTPFRILEDCRLHALVVLLAGITDEMPHFFDMTPVPIL